MTLVIDTSALIAILRDEPDAPAFASAIAAADQCHMSIASYVETGMIVDLARNPIASRQLDRFLHDANVELCPVTPEQGKIARLAYQDFGKGRGHPAQLNYGDCFAYALAIDMSVPLLFKGNDFAHTDVAIALPRPN